MCDFNPHKNTAEWHDEKKYHLSDFFNQWWDTYKQSPKEFITPE